MGHSVLAPARGGGLGAPATLRTALAGFVLLAAALLNPAVAGAQTSTATATATFTATPQASTATATPTVAASATATATPTLTPTATPQPPNAIQSENSLPGDPAWGDFTTPNTPAGISGYGSRISV